MSVFDNAEYTFGLQGPPGAATVEQVADLEARVAAREAITIPTVLNDMTDVSGTPATGALLRFDGSGWVPYTPVPITVPILISLAAGSESADPTVGRQAVIDVNFACTITGWSVKNRTAGSVEWDVLVGGVSITGTAKPKTTSALDGGSTTLTGWTTTIASGTPLEIYINSASGTNISAFNLHLTRSLTWGS